jgi:hypothetical protein
MHEDDGLGGVLLLCLFLIALFVLCYDCAVIMLFLLLFFFFLFFVINVCIACWKDWHEPESESDSEEDEMIETEVAIIVKQEDISVIN